MVTIQIARTFSFPGNVDITISTATTIVADIFNVAESQVKITIGGRRLSSKDVGFLVATGEGRQL